MSIGAFGENFPYSNFHDLNMDWIIKIAKDFLDQYTHIQDLVDSGIESLDEKTQESITVLEAKKDELENLLNAWYTTHSNDIANQLATSLDTLSLALTNTISSFNSAADTKTAQSIASIPSDYTALSNAVTAVSDRMNYFIQFYSVIENKNLVNSAFIKNGQWINTNYQVINEPNSKRLILPVLGGTIISLCFGFSVQLVITNVGGIIYYDKDMNPVQNVNIGSFRSRETYQGFETANFKLPDNVAYFSITIKLSVSWDATNTMIIKYGSGFGDYSGYGNTIISLGGSRIADESLRNAITTQQYEEETIITTAKKLLQATGAVIDYDNAEYLVTNHIPVKNCDTVKVTGNSAFGNGICAFYDKNDIVISVPLVAAQGSSRTYCTDVVLGVPFQAEYMIISGAPHTMPKCEKLTLIPSDRQNSNLYGKMVTVIGDSITEHNSSALHNWCDYMEEKTGCTIQNLGRSGSGFYRNSPYINRISSINQSTDIIGVAISFNDAGYLPTGEYRDTGTQTLCGWARDFFTALLTAFPATPIICYSQGPWANYHNYGPSAVSTDFVNAIKQVCNSLGIPCYNDLYLNGSALRPWDSANQNVYYKNETSGTLDPTHPNSNGHVIIANYLTPLFEQNIANI